MSSPRLAMAEFDYELPPSAIAHVPADPRDSARLLVDRGGAETPHHRLVSDLPTLLRAGDVLVVNETRVMPARLRLRKRTGGAAEVLLVAPLHAQGWAALVRPSRRIADGAVLVSERDPRVEVTVRHRLDDQSRVVEVRVGDVLLTDVSQANLLELAGEAPLPPYIDPAAAERALAAGGGFQAGDDASARRAVAERYQTVYARCDGAVAAPTAGLHLTERVLAELRARGVGVATVDLTVGLGTFAPVTAAHADDHQMHAEHFRVPAATLAACDAAERVIAVGTTTVRALESAARLRLEHTGAADQPARAQHRTEPDVQDAQAVSGTTDLFLRRGSAFLAVDAMLTNFHLPRSSLLLLIDAFIGPRWRDLYRVALEQRYRFLSFGDAMLLWRS